MIWIAVLTALVYTSGYATFLGFGGSITSFFQRLSTAIGQTGQSSSDLIVLATTLLAMVLLVSQILLAWRRFAAFTNDLIVSYARPEYLNTANTPFFDLLIWDVPDHEDIEDNEDEAEAELDPDRADSSSVSDVLKPMSFAWAIILLTPPVLSIVAALFTTSFRF